MPPNICNPAYLAEQAKILADEYENISTEVLGENEMEALNMGSYLAVGRGSANESMMSIIGITVLITTAPPLF